MGGSIEVISKIGIGSCFSIYIPIARQADEEAAPGLRGQPTDKPVIRAIAAGLLPDIYI